MSWRAMPSERQWLVLPGKVENRPLPSLQQWRLRIKNSGVWI
jgi:hypothetical protein